MNLGSHVFGSENTIDRLEKLFLKEKITTQQIGQNTFLEIIYRKNKLTPFFILVFGLVFGGVSASLEV